MQRAGIKRKLSEEELFEDVFDKDGGEDEDNNNMGENAQAPSKQQADLMKKEIVVDEIKPRPKRRMLRNITKLMEPVVVLDDGIYDFKEHDSAPLDFSDNKRQLRARPLRNKRVIDLELEEPDFVALEITFLTEMDDRGWSMVRMAGDGACMFRAVAFHLFGSQNLHAQVRKCCMDFMEEHSEMFIPFIPQEFKKYIRERRRPSCYGDNVELKALSCLYNRKIEVYKYSTTPFESIGNVGTPIRLAYLRNNHYDAIVDTADVFPLKGFEEKIIASDSLSENFVTTMEENNLFIYPVAEDASSLFRAVAVIMFKDEKLHTICRKDCVDFIEENQSYFEALMEGNFEDYVCNMRNKDTLPDDIALVALSGLYSKIICIYKDGIEPYQQINMLGTENDNSYPIRILRIRDVHYDALIYSNELQFRSPKGLMINDDLQAITDVPEIKPVKNEPGNEPVKADPAECDAPQHTPVEETDIIPCASPILALDCLFEIKTEERNDEIIDDNREG